MSSPAGSPLPSRSWSSSATDPSVPDPLDALFRGSSAGRSAQPAVRHYEPSLRPPDGSDGYGWLYRPEPVPQPGGSGLVADPSVGAGPSLADGPAATVRRGRRWPVVALLAALAAGAAAVSWAAASWL